MAKQIPPCAVCGKATKAECSHTDCANRRKITAQVSDKPEQPWADDREDTVGLPLRMGGG